MTIMPASAIIYILYVNIKLFIIDYLSIVAVFR